MVEAVNSTGDFISEVMDLSTATPITSNTVTESFGSRNIAVDQCENFPSTEPIEEHSVTAEASFEQLVDTESFLGIHGAALKREVHLSQFGSEVTMEKAPSFSRTMATIPLLELEDAALFSEWRCTTDPPRPEKRCAGSRNKGLYHARRNNPTPALPPKPPYWTHDAVANPPPPPEPPDLRCCGFAAQFGSMRKRPSRVRLTNPTTPPPQPPDQSWPKTIVAEDHMPPPPPKPPDATLLARAPPIYPGTSLVVAIWDTLKVLNNAQFSVDSKLMTTSWKDSNRDANMVVHEFNLPLDASTVGLSRLCYIGFSSYEALSIFSKIQNHPPWQLDVFTSSTLITTYVDAFKLDWIELLFEAIAQRSIFHNTVTHNFILIGDAKALHAAVGLTSILTMIEIISEIAIMMPIEGVPIILLNMSFLSSSYSECKQDVYNQLLEELVTVKQGPSLKDVSEQEPSNLANKLRSISVRDLTSKFAINLAAAIKLFIEAKLREVASFEGHVLLEKLSFSNSICSDSTISDLVQEITPCYHIAASTDIMMAVRLEQWAQARHSQLTLVGVHLIVLLRHSKKWDPGVTDYFFLIKGTLQFKQWDPGGCYFVQVSAGQDLKQKSSSRAASHNYGAKLFGDAKEAAVNNNIGNLKFYICGLIKIQVVPLQGAQGSSYSENWAIEMSLYINAASTLKSSSSHFNFVGNRWRIDTVIADLVKSEATWEDATFIQQRYFDFNLEDKVDFYGDGNVMIPTEGAKSAN